jgi:D-tyrosyl-tRNA(Tyr) deacylase
MTSPPSTICWRRSSVWLKGTDPLRAVVQRTGRASVTVDGAVRGEIVRGLVVLLGVGKGDSDDDAAYLANKTAGLRIFEDAAGKMSLSLRDVGGEVLVISQFTLYGDVRRGLRPSFDAAAAPADAVRLYKRYCDLLRQEGLTVQTGVFQAMMDVQLVNNGPVTILLDSQKTF